MPLLSPNTVVLSDGDLKLYKRARSKVWQASFKIEQHWVRISTKCKDLDKAKKAAKELMLEYQIRQKHQIPVVSKKFADVARLAIAEMRKAMDSGNGKRTYRDYIIVIEKYFIPFFGTTLITNIDYAKLQAFDSWRTDKMGREPRASTLNTHNSALSRVFDEAVVRGFLSKSHVPVLKNKGRRSKRRPSFAMHEYRSLVQSFPAWVQKGRKGKSREMRELLRDYVLILANTGIREGTEADNLLWQHVHLFYENGEPFLEMSVNGKTGTRDIICRANTLTYLKRIHERTNDIKHMSFDQLMKAKLPKPVFRLPDGTVTKNLHQTFRAFLRDTDLLVCPKTGQHRTLYSLRHTYATFALARDGMNIHTLAVQMGTSIKMIEKHYSHLEPIMKKEMLTGPRFGARQKAEKEAEVAAATAAADAIVTAAVAADIEQE